MTEQVHDKRQAEVLWPGEEGELAAADTSGVPMKAIWLLSVLLVFAGCVTTSDVTPMGRNTFIVSTDARGLTTDDPGNRPPELRPAPNSVIELRR